MKLAHASLMIALAAGAMAGETVLAIPGSTAYAEPEARGIRIGENGIDGWSDPTRRVAWHGRFASAGRLEPALLVVLPQGETATLRLAVGGATQAATVTGLGDQPARAAFPALELAAAGWQALVLEGTAKSGRTFGRITALELAGPAAAGAHFNLKPRRNSASVHLGYPLPKDAATACFYAEVTARSEPLWTYYEVCGFSRGYFGIQVNSATERRIIFSVWDSGNEGVDRAKVAADDRVQLLAKGDGVVASDFGNEGTGGHSHLVHPWTIGTTYRLAVTARPEGTHTTYSGWFFFAERRQWGLIASFKAPKDGGWLRGLYSFAENFNGENGDQRRLAEFGNQWARGADGAWRELLRARFTHDPTGAADRLDRGAALVDGRFALFSGGFTGEPLTAGSELARPGGGMPPADLPAE
jgi:hypothetical protein